jgi:hypothetical protein
MFEFRTPMYFIRDPEIIKTLTVKEFDHFVNHREIIPEDAEPIFSQALFGLKDQKWKGNNNINLFKKNSLFFNISFVSEIDMRATLSPAFTGRASCLQLNMTSSLLISFFQNRK